MVRVLGTMTWRLSPALVDVRLACFGCGSVREGDVVDSGRPFGSEEGGAVWVESVGQGHVVGFQHGGQEPGCWPWVVVKWWGHTRGGTSARLRRR